MAVFVAIFRMVNGEKMFLTNFDTKYFVWTFMAKALLSNPAFYYIVICPDNLCMI